MSHRITRRKFAAAGAAALGLPVLETGRLVRGRTSPARSAANGFATLPVRPYQLMCVVCRLARAAPATWAIRD